MRSDIFCELMIVTKEQQLHRTKSQIVTECVREM